MSKESELSISDKKQQLDELLAWFNSDDFAIELAPAKFEEASKLADEIIKELEQYRNKIEVLAKRFDDAGDGE